MRRWPRVSGRGQGGCVEFGDAERLDGADIANDVDDGINGPNFVEVDLFKADAVNLGLGLAQRAKDGGGCVAHPG